MKVKSAGLIGFVFLLSFSSLIPASSAGERILELTLRECIDLALTGNLGLRSSYLGLRAEELSVVQAESRFDPALSLNMTRAHSETPTFFQYYGVRSIARRSSQVNFTLEQSLFTGGSWGVGMYNTLSESNIETEKNYTSSFGISLSQPLLRGFGRKVSRSGIYLARLSRESTVFDIENRAVELVYEVQRAYWELVFARRSLEVKELSVRQADSLLVYNRKGLELGVLTESDVLEAESMLLSRRQEVLDQRNRIRDAEDVLRRLLDLTSEEDMKSRLVPVDTPRVVEPEKNTEDAFRLAIELRPDYRLAEKRLEQYEVNRDVARNGMLPSLDLNVRYNIHGSGRTFDRDVKDMGDFEQYGWNVGLMLSYPLRNRSAKAEFQKREIDMKRAGLALRELENRIRTEIRAAERRMEMLREQIDVAKLSVEINELKLRKEEEKFRNQLSTSYYVLQFQRDLADSRNRYNKALIDYTMAVNEYRKVCGTLLRDLKISIIGMEN